MGDSYLPPRSRREVREHRAERGRYTHDNDYDPYARYDRDERYGRSDRYDVRERRRSPPPRSPPRDPCDRYGARDEGYTFRGAAARDDDRAPPGQFSFRTSGPRFPSPGRYGPPPPPRAPQSHRRGDNSRRGDHRRGGPQGQRGGHPRWRPPPPSSRKILHETGRASTPEQLEGMNHDSQVRFNALVSSSGESDDDDQPARPTSSSEEEGEIRRKRFKVDAPPASASDVPKWSNPDPYSVLPPTEGIGAPKKDIVQVIRKAKNDVAPRSDMTQGAAKNADFISFTFDDDFDDDKASTGQVDAVGDDPSDASSSTFTMSGLQGQHGTHAPNGDRVPSFPLKRSNREDAAPPSQPSPIDLMSEDDAPPPRKRQNLGDASNTTRPPPIDLTGDDDAPPPPPNGFVMPTDEELMQQYTGQPKGKKRKHAEQSKGKGDITDAWEANWSNSTPWCAVDRSHTADVNLRLHEEITDFFDFVRPHHYEEALRQDIIQRVQAAVRGSGGGDARNVDIKCFGSFAAGLYLPIADMDLVAVSRTFMSYGQRSFCQTSGKMHKLTTHMIRSGIAQEGTTSTVARAKVPIIKFTDKKTGIKVDISFENDSGLMANTTFQQWKLQHPAMPILVVLVKQMLAMRDLNEVFTGGLGGFSIICLVVSMLQHMPDDEYEEMVRNEDYGALLLRFLDLYGNQFNLRSTGIIMNPPSYYDKIRNPMRNQNANNLTIIDPNNPMNDISGGSREVHAVFEVFRKAHSQLLQRMSKVNAGKDVHDSILGCVLGGNYTSFIHQRSRMYKLFGGQDVSPPPEPAGNGQPPPQKRKRAKPGDQGPPSKNFRGNDGMTQTTLGGPLAARVQGGPPAKQGKSSTVEPSNHDPASATKEKRKSKRGGGVKASYRREKRANSLKAIYPDLAHEVPAQLSHKQARKMGLSKKNEREGKKMLASTKKKKKKKKKKSTKKA